MARASFESLSTERFRIRMRPCAEKIYRSVFPGCKLVDLRKGEHDVHLLDKSFGIDSLLRFDCGQYITLQEKYRSHRYLGFDDFTQEYKNGVGTTFESPGEFFRLAAQLYFYGWANETQTDFCRWIMLDILKYKLLVQRSGGLDRLGTKKQNAAHGRSVFYSIPIVKLKPAILVSSDTSKNGRFWEKWDGLAEFS